MPDKIYMLEPTESPLLKIAQGGPPPDWINDKLRPITETDMTIAKLQCAMLDAAKDA